MPNLVGIGLSQVPTNSMLGGMAYQDPDRVKIKKLNVDEISQINSEIADTAVDIFVYDTSKDSDGGAWRKRTTHTSWYNETLGTATRGTRREFPAVAVIIAQETPNQQVVIYDGDDPNLPMWMVFERGGDNDPFLDGSTPGASFLGNYAPTSVSAFNGIICAGCWRSAGAISNLNAGLRRFSFIEDNCIAFNDSNSYKIGDVIANRNVITMNQHALGNSIVNVNVNDVEMTVLPNAPVDIATGLPIPTIAVATDGGVSVIKDDETVVDIVSSYGPTDNSDYVEFTKSGGLVLDMGHNGDRSWLHTFDVIPSSDTTVTVNTKNAASGSSPVGWYDVTTIFGADLIVLSSGQSDQIDTRTLYGDTIVATTGKGMTFIDEYARSPSNGMVAYVTTSYNTGWMHGDIKGAFLSDTDDTNLSTTDLGLITNGDFSNGTTGWSNDSTPTFTVSGGGVASVDRNGGGATGQCYQTITTEVGRTYTVGVLVSAVSNGFQVYAGESPAASNITMSHGAINSTGTHYWTFTATTTSTRLDFSATQNVNGTASFDNITIFDGVADRSVNSKGLSVYGTVTKSAVATGADLVSYGPFSNSNRLRQPYNSGLNFGTGDFSVIFWMYNTGSTVHQTLVGRDNREFSVDILDNANYDRKFRIYAFNSGNSLQTFDSNADPFPLNTWSHVCVNYTNGNTAAIYVNGVLNKSGTLNYDIDDTSNGLNIGCRNTSGSYAYPADATKLSLVRISGSAPSAQEVKKIYNNEKHLFHENAKATLYGSSDDVKAIAYDESTEELHVGTSSGRSDFQGLRRINNTTTAVTTAISAHDGFIVEQ